MLNSIRLKVCGAVICLALTSGAYAATHDHPEPVVLAPGYAALEFTPPTPGSYPLPALGRAADGAVLGPDGSAVRLHDFLGDKVVVLSFIFTRCSDVNGCPLATFVMKGVQNKVLSDPLLAEQVRVISFSFDPAYDTPEVLGEYAAHFKDPEFDWQFLTTRGDADLEPILNAYDQWIIKDYDEEGNFLGSISHVLRVYLIDREKRIRNIYSTSFLHADTVGADIATVLALEQPAEKEVTGATPGG